jgi:hypothetical protein
MRFNPAGSGHARLMKGQTNNDAEELRKEVSTVAGGVVGSVGVRTWCVCCVCGCC